MKQNKNYLDFVSSIKESLEWKELESGMIQIKMENAVVFNFISQKLFGRPRFSYIDLEEFGSFIWKQIDGKSTIFEIGKSVSEKLKDKAEPLYPRLSQYFKTLQLHGFINAE
ncbi:PqqD family protein [Treponema sp.]|uniref:PqqD family protein n=1 Tax=Treponema sp. TaxID=166 RepID=UPI002A7F9CE7|nr:PqqD family protein [Treponema sp.]MCI6442572.1 PqqD family protein [Spirochaetia bacterium]MDY4133040.1 PqqD family protein [Treponema sp.]